MGSIRRSSLARLYPKRWRRRYGDEFRALLEDEPLSPELVVDVFAGALRAHLRYTSEELVMSIHRLQAAAVVLGVVAIVALPFVLAAAAAKEFLLDPAMSGLGSTMLPETSAIIERWLAVAAASGFVLVLGLVALGWRFRNNPALRGELVQFGRLLRRLAMAAGLLIVLGAFTVVMVVPLVLIVSNH